LRIVLNFSTKSPISCAHPFRIQGLTAPGYAKSILGLAFGSFISPFRAANRQNVTSGRLSTDNSFSSTKVVDSKVIRTPRYHNLLHDGIRACYCLLDIVSISSPIFHFHRLQCLEVCYPLFTTAHSSLTSFAGAHNPLGIPSQRTDTPRRYLGLGAPCCAEEEDFIHEEEIPVYGRKGPEGCHIAQPMFWMWEYQTGSFSVPLLCEW
jgi:hypothetical protein